MGTMSDFKNVGDVKTAATHIIGKKRVIQAYKLYLDGTPIDEIKEVDQVKDKIREFEKYSMLTAYEISQKSHGLDSDTAAALRRVKKMHRRKDKEQQSDFLEYAVKKKLENVSDSYLQGRRGVKVATLWRSKTLIRLAKEGQSPAKIAKTVGLGEYKVKKILENIKIKVEA